MNEPAKVVIKHDDTPESPLDWDRLGTMNFRHRRYTLGDSLFDFSDLVEHEFPEVRAIDEWYDEEEYKIRDLRNDDYLVIQRRLAAELNEKLEKLWESNTVCLNVYMYEHGGIVLRTHPFGDPWDSGQLGVIYVTYSKLRKEYGIPEGEPIPQDVLEKATRRLKAEVETYSQYLAGDVYGFEVQDSEGEVLDSCWGFYGSDWSNNGVMDYLQDVLPKDSPLLDQKTWVYP